MTLAALSLGGAIIGCGDGNSGDIPEGAVAIVGDQPIARSELNRRYNPYVARIRDLGSTSPLGAKAKLVRSQLKRNLITTIIEAEWLEREAAAQGIRVPDAEVARWYEHARDNVAQSAQVGGDTDVYRLRLRIAKGHETDRRSEARAELIRRKLIAKAIAGPVGDRRIRAYYEANKKNFIRPEQRFLRFIPSTSQREGQQAVESLRAGKSWNDASTERRRESRLQHTRGTYVVKTGLAKPLADVVFEAPAGKVIGPVKAGSFWFVFEVTRIAPPAQQQLNQVRDVVTKQLAENGFAQEFNRISRTLKSRYRSETYCAPGFKVPLCSNYSPNS